MDPMGLIKRFAGEPAIFLSLIILTTACAGSRTGVQEPEPNLERLFQWMVGSFDNTAALANSEKQAVEEHFPIQVQVSPVPSIPHALYIEQASMEAPDRPYRQRVYTLTVTPAGDLLVKVWLLENPKEWIGAWDDPDRLSAITLEDLVHRDGCDVYLAWDGRRYVGGTLGQNCESALAGASYATSSVTINPDGFTSLDQGFNSDGEQVWGAEKRPYEFRRRK